MELFSGFGQKAEPVNSKMEQLKSEGFEEQMVSVDEAHPEEFDRKINELRQEGFEVEILSDTIDYSGGWPQREIFVRKVKA